MSENGRLCAVGCLLGLLLAGCDGVKLCQKCERPPETVKLEVDWQKLADALKDAGVGEGATVVADSINVTVDPDRPTGRSNGPQPPGQKDVTVAGWTDLVEALKSIETAAQSARTIENVENITHATFSFRFAPPWFNADQRSLLTSYVVFPVEAKFAAWRLRADAWPEDHPPKKEGCQRGADAPASICPDVTFYEKAMKPFLEGLSQCATDKKVELHLLGFASATRVGDPGKENKAFLTNRYDNYINDSTQSCRGERDPEERGDVSNMFNLLIANERAINAAAMLKSLVPDEPKNAFDIKVTPWCSHAAMVAERGTGTGNDPAQDLMSRRVEVRLAALPGCLNVDPDKRIPTVEGPTQAS